MYGKLTYVPASGGKTVEHLVSQRLTYVGRDKDCAIRVEDDSVDGKQFVISVIDEQVRIQNLSWKSRTLVNDISIGIREERELGNRDTISIGSKQFLWTMSTNSEKRTSSRYDCLKRHDCLKRSRTSEPVRKVAVVTPHRREAPVAEDSVMRMPPEKRRRTMFDTAGTPDTSAFVRRVKYDKALKEKMTPSRKKQPVREGTPTSVIKKKSISFARQMESPRMNYDHQTVFNKSITPGKFYRGSSAPFAFGGFRSVPEEPTSPGLLSGCESFLSMNDSPKSRRSSCISTPYPNKSLTNSSLSNRTLRNRAPSAYFPPIHDKVATRAHLDATPSSYFSSTSGSPRMMRAQSPTILPGGSRTPLRGSRSLALSSRSSSYGTPQDLSVNSHDSLYVNASTSSQMRFQDFEGWSSRNQSPRSDSFAHTPPHKRMSRRSREPNESTGSAAFSPNQSRENTSGYVLLSPRGRNIIDRAFSRNDMSLQMSSQQSPSRRLFNFSSNMSDNPRAVQPLAQPLSVQVLTKSLKKKLGCSAASTPQNYMATPNSKTKEIRVADGSRTAVCQSSEPDSPRSSRMSSDHRKNISSPTPIKVNESGPKKSLKETPEPSTAIKKKSGKASPLNNDNPRLSRHSTRSVSGTPRQSGEPGTTLPTRKVAETTPSPLASPSVSGVNTRSTKKIPHIAREGKLVKSWSAESVVVTRIKSIRNSLPAKSFNFKKSKRIKAPIRVVAPATRSSSQLLTPNSSKGETPGLTRRSRTLFDSPRISPTIQGSPIPSSITKRNSRNFAMQSPLSKTSIISRRSLSSTPRQSNDPDQSSGPDFVSPKKASFLRRTVESSSTVSPHDEQAVQSGRRFTNCESVSPGKITPFTTSDGENVRSRKVSFQEKDLPSRSLSVWKRKLAKSLSADSEVVNHGSFVRNSLPAFLENSHKSVLTTKRLESETTNNEEKGNTCGSKRRSRASIIGEAAHIFHTADSPGSKKSPPKRLTNDPASGEPSLGPTVSHGPPSHRSSRASKELLPLRSLRSSGRHSVAALPRGIRKSSQIKKSRSLGDHAMSIRGQPSNGIDVDESSARTEKRASNRPVPVTPPRTSEPEIFMRSSRKNSRVSETVSPPTPTSALRRSTRRSVKKTSVRSLAKKLSLISRRKDSEVKKLTLDPERPDKNKIAALIACHKKKSPTKENRPTTSFLNEKMSPCRSGSETLRPVEDLDSQPEKRSQEDQLLDALDLSRKSSIATEPKRPSRRLRSSTSKLLSTPATESLNISKASSLPASPTKNLKKLFFKTPLVEYEQNRSREERSPTRTIKGILSPTLTTSSEEPMNRVFTTSPVVDFTDASGRKKIFIASPISKSKAGGIRELVPTDETDLNIRTLFEDSSPGSSSKKRKGTETYHSSSGKKAKFLEKLEVVSPPQTRRRKRVVQQDSEVILSRKRTHKRDEEFSKKTPPVARKTRKAATANVVKSTPSSDKSTPPKAINKKGSSRVLKKAAANVKAAFKAPKMKSSSPKSPKSPTPAKTRRKASAKTAKTTTEPKRMAGKATRSVSKTVPSLAKPKKDAKPTKTKSGGAGASKSLPTRRGAKPRKAETKPSKALPKARGNKASQSHNPVPSSAKTRKNTAGETLSTAKIEPKAGSRKAAPRTPLKPSKTKKASNPRKTAPKRQNSPASAASSLKAVAKAKPLKPLAPRRSQISPKKTRGTVAASKASAKLVSPHKTRGKVVSSKASLSHKMTKCKIATTKPSRKSASANKATKGKAKTQGDDTKTRLSFASTIAASEASPKKTRAKVTTSKASSQPSPKKARGKIAVSKALPKPTSAKKATQGRKAATQGAKTKAPKLSVPPKAVRGKAVRARSNKNESPKKSTVPTRSRKATTAPASRGKR